jgi:hypothetical protein
MMRSVESSQGSMRKGGSCHRTLVLVFLVFLLLQVFSRVDRWARVDSTSGLEEVIRAWPFWPLCYFLVDFCNAQVMYICLSSRSFCNKFQFLGLEHLQRHFRNKCRLGRRQLHIGSVGTWSLAIGRAFHTGAYDTAVPIELKFQNN